MPSRLDRLRERMCAEGVDALLISQRFNIRYLSGFTGSTAALAVTQAGADLFTDSRYGLQAREEVEGTGVRIVQGHALGAAAGSLAGDGRIGFEADHLTVSLHGALCREIPPEALVPTSGVVEGMRRIKDPCEVESIRASARLNSRAFESGLRAVAPGTTEREVAAEIEMEMRKGGASGPAFDSIVASGERGALPHARASDRPLRRGEPVVVDIGASLDGYASDMTRTVFLEDPGERGLRVHGAVLRALEKACEAARPGRPAWEVDRAARVALEDEGFEEYAYRHGTGHGVGLEVHEAPRVARGCKDELAAGMVITVEPGVYIAGWGGVRIEDMVVVEEDGCRTLTPTARDLLVL